MRLLNWRHLAKCARNAGLTVCIALLGAVAAAEAIESDPFVVYLSPMDSVLADRTVEILRDGIDHFEAKLPAGDRPIEVYVAQSYREFRELGAPQGRVDGFAASAAGVIVIKAPNLLTPGGDYASILRHELLHVLLARNSGTDHLPRWLNEGLAMMLSRENRWTSMYQVARMYTGGRIIEYASLPYVFATPGNEEEFGDAYAQSLSMTKYLRDRLGEDGFWRLVSDLKAEEFGNALRARAGLSEEQFYQQWYDSLWTISVVASVISGFGLFQCMAVLLVIAYIRKRRRGQRVLAGWAEEDEDDAVFAWQLEDQDPPHAWEEDDGEEYRPNQRL